MNKKALKDIGIVITGKTPSKKEPKYFDGDIPFITPAELGKSQFVYSSPQTLTELGAAQIKMLPENTVMMCCIGSLGKCAIAGKAMATNQQINSIIFDENKVYYKYGFYAVQQLKPLMEHLAPATTVQILNKSSFEKLEIPVPSLDEQHHIAQTLDQATSLIEKRKAQIAELDKLVKAVFLEMFGDPIANNKKFPTDKVINIVKLQRGFDLPVQDRIKGKYNVWGSNGILSSHSDFSVKAPTIITGRSGTIGNVYYTFDDCWALNTTLFGVETYGNNVIYLSYLMNFFKLERFSSGTGVPTLNRNNVHDQDIIKVPLDLQTLFAQKVCKIEAEKDRLQRSLVEMENNLTALMGRFFG